MKNKQYYVYGLIDPRNNEYFYIGKGKGNRHVSHFTNRDFDQNTLKNQRISEIENEFKKPKAEILFADLDEETAYEIEAIIIFKLGRQILFEGTLTNLVPGGKWKHGDSVTFKEKINPTFDLNKLNPSSQKKFQSFKKISSFNYLNIKYSDQIIYKYDYKGKFESALTLDEFFKGAVTNETANILKQLRENDFPIYYGNIYSKVFFDDIYISKHFNVPLLEIIDQEFHRQFDNLNKIKVKFTLESKINKNVRLKITKNDNILSMTSFYKKGNLKYFKSTKDGDDYGVQFEWYENGNLKIESGCAGKNCNYSHSYYPNGKKNLEVNEFNGFPKYNKWSERGFLQKKFVVNVGTIIYDENGKYLRTELDKKIIPSKQTTLNFDVTDKSENLSEKKDDKSSLKYLDINIIKNKR